MVLAMDFNDATAYAPDVASEDSAAGLSIVEAGLPTVAPVVAYGLSEGGSVAALMIEHHPGLVSGWVDTAGSVDLYAEAEQLYADQAPLALDVDAGFDSTLLNLLLTAVGPADDPDRIAQLSPIDEQTLLSSLKHAVLIQATGDTLVPFESSAEMAGALAALKVPTKLEALIPAAGQEVTGFTWHVTAAEYTATYAALKDLLSTAPSFSSGLTTISTAITTAE
jgi:pimeloyl-ACP methyl ester carboxylesterase